MRGFPGSPVPRLQGSAQVTAPSTSVLMMSPKKLSMKFCRALGSDSHAGVLDPLIWQGLLQVERFELHPQDIKLKGRKKHAAGVHRPAAVFKTVGKVDRQRTLLNSSL